MPGADLAALARLVDAVDPAGLPALGLQWQRAVDGLVKLWVTDVWLEQLASALRQVDLAVRHDNLEAIVQLRVPVLGERMLLAAMQSIAAAGAAAVVAEARAQGAPAVLPPPMASSRLADWARVTARRLADTFTALVAAEALRWFRPAADPAEVTRAVSAHVAELTDRGPRDMLGGALTQAQNLARLDAYDRPPPGWKVRLFADETLDERTCDPCRDIDGTELPNADAAALAYGGAGYIHCLGGYRCRGTMTGVWSKLDDDPGMQALHTLLARAASADVADGAILNRSDGPVVPDRAGEESDDGG